MLTIGLFGTCGRSQWRLPFMRRYDVLGIPYFNPQVENWHPGLVAEENRHLAEDRVILFPVTDETTGQGSLCETGYSIAQASRVNRHRFFVFMIDEMCRATDASPAQIKESNRARALVKSKLQDEARANANVFLVPSLDAMLPLSIELFEIATRLDRAVRTYTAAA